MNKILVLLLLIPFLSFGKKIVYVRYLEKDTLAQGEKTYIDIDYDPMEFSSFDTIRIRINNSATYQLIELLKISIHDADTITPQADHTKRLYFTIPFNYPTTPITSLNVNYSQSRGWSYFPIQISSSTPDISIKSWSSSIDTTQQIFAMTIDYTYQPTNQDSLKIFIGDSLVYNGNYQKSLSFNIPDFINSATYNLTIVGCPDNIPLNISRRNSLVSGLFSPIINDSGDIYYYNEQGMQIDKPEHGFYIWKSKNGSGKSCISE